MHSFLQRLTRKEAKLALQMIDEGMSGNYVRVRTMVHKVIRQGILFFHYAPRCM